MSTVTVTSNTAMSDIATLGSLIGWTDQVAAAVSEVTDAWRIFLGGEPDAPMQPQEAEAWRPRLETGSEQLKEQVSILQALAQDIRQRI